MQRCGGEESVTICFVNFVGVCQGVISMGIIFSERLCLFSVLLCIAMNAAVLLVWTEGGGGGGLLFVCYYYLFC